MTLVNYGRYPYDSLVMRILEIHDIVGVIASFLCPVETLNEKVSVLATREFRDLNHFANTCKKAREIIAEHYLSKKPTPISIVHKMKLEGWTIYSGRTIVTGTRDRNVSLITDGDKTSLALYVREKNFPDEGEIKWIINQFTCAYNDDELMTVGPNYPSLYKKYDVLVRRGLLDEPVDRMEFDNESIKCLLLWILRFPDPANFLKSFLRCKDVRQYCMNDKGRSLITDLIKEAYEKGYHRSMFVLYRYMKELGHSNFLPEINKAFKGINEIVSQRKSGLSQLRLEVLIQYILFSCVLSSLIAWCLSQKTSR